MGIPEDIINRIDESDFNTKEWGQHQGAGLDITKEIIFKHNGKMKVESGGINTFAKFALTFTP